MNNVPRVLLVGAHGRMGRAIAAAAAKEPGLTIKAELGRGDPITPGIDDCDVVIDFSSADATEAVCRACAEHRKALVLGTTGHNATQKTSIAAAARQIPIVFAANFSVGVNALFALTRRAAELLGGEFDVDVIEMHHRTKKDAPSGTAKRLVEILTDVGEAEPPGCNAFDSGRRHRGRPHGHLYRTGRAAGTDSSRHQPGNFCGRGVARRTLDHRPTGRALQHGKCARFLETATSSAARGISGNRPAATDESGNRAGRKSW